MPTFATWSAAVKRLLAALAALEPEAQRIGVSSPAESQWYELLRYKLLPQLELPPVLVVAVVGGTNIGKSVVFNHLAGEEASASSPLAAGTKHPVCLVPPGFDDPALLSRLFEPFELTPWRSPEDALSEDPRNLLFWRVGRNVAPRLLILDVPDVDSDAVVNWERARAVRDTADVLLGVLTQQKYNDAAVKHFFRDAVEARKPVVVLFNQCDLEADRPYWPQWLSTFAGQTGAKPDLVYVMPYDRAAARSLRLPFYEVGPEGAGPPALAADLRQELASLHFDAIKIRTFQGAMARVLDRREGGSGLPRGNPRGGRWFLHGGRRAVGPRNGPRRLAHAPGQHPGRRDPGLVGFGPGRVVAPDPRFLSHPGTWRDLAVARGLGERGRTGARSAVCAARAGTRGDRAGRGEDTR